MGPLQAVALGPTEAVAPIAGCASRKKNDPIVAETLDTLVAPDRQLSSALLLLLPAALAVALSYHAAGTAAGASTLTGVVLTLAFILSQERPVAGKPGALDRISAIGLTGLPAALTVYFAFNAGGFFPDSTGVGTLVVAYILMARIALAQRPFEGFTRPLGIAAAALVLYALWTLLSVFSSDAPERALVEFDRASLYALAFVLFASVPKTSERLRWMVRSVAVAFVAICAAALVTRVLPEVWSIPRTYADNRLNFPLTYWNALGLVASLGFILCFHLSASEREPPLVRVLASAGIPVLAAALLLTLSRGAIAAGIVGLLVYVAAARPRALLGALIALVPATAITLAVTYDANLLVSSTEPTSPEAVAQGHSVALAAGLCALAAAGLRLLLLAVDARLARISLSPAAKRVFAGATAVVGVLIVVGASVSIGFTGGLREQYDRFANSPVAGDASDPRQRLTSVGNNERLDPWKVALDDFDEHALRGRGAGTWGLSWNQERPGPREVLDAHSLSLEVLGELGLVGTILLGTGLGILLLGLARRSTGLERTLYAAAFSAGIAWLLHAQVDWDWEMPAVTIWLFMVGATALSREPVAEVASRRSPMALRAGLILAVSGVAALAGVIAISETNANRSLAAIEVGDCNTAVDAAQSSNSVLATRVRAYEIEAYCDASAGRNREAAEAMQKAVERDPDNWEPHYGLAVVQAAAGLDSRQAARQAARLNPREPLTRDALELSAAQTPEERKRRAQEALLSLGPDGPALLLVDL